MDELTTERLVLLTLHERHAKSFFAGFSNPTLYQFIPQEPPINIAALASEFCSRHAGAPANIDEIWLNWAVRLQSSAIYIGRIEVTILPNKTANLAYVFSEDYWGLGYAREACKAVINNLQAEHGLTQITADIDTRNAASIKLVEALQFKRLGTAYAVDTFKGESSDEYMYGLRFVQTPAVSS